MNKLLCEVLSMCYRISRYSYADVFFEYAPHCNAYSIFYYPDGWTKNTAGELVWMNTVTLISYENLKDTIKKLNALANEMEVL